MAVTGNPNNPTGTLDPADNQPLIHPSTRHFAKTDQRNADARQCGVHDLADCCAHLGQGDLRGGRSTSSGMAWPN
jgi:hypothetical protein